MTATSHVLPLAPPAKPVGAVTVALGILRCLGRHAESLRLSDIVREEGINNSTALNILRTLEYEGLVAFDRRTKRYGLAEGLADLAAPLLDSRDAGRRADRAMLAAAHELRATIALWRVVEGGEVELVRVADPPEATRIAFMVGGRLPMFLGAFGRLIAARGTWTEAELQNGFDAVPWGRVPDYDEWQDEIVEARTSGFAVDAGFVNVGVLGVAVPVERTGPLVHVIAAARFARDCTIDPNPIAARLRAVANEVS